MTATERYPRCLSRRQFIALCAAATPGLWLTACALNQTPNFEDEIRKAALAACAPLGGIDYDPTATFPPFARALGLGMPLTQELEYAGYRFQGYAGGIIYAPGANPTNIRVLSW